MFYIKYIIILPNLVFNNGLVILDNYFYSYNFIHWKLYLKYVCEHRYIFNFYLLMLNLFSQEFYSTFIIFTKPKAFKV